MQKLKIYTYISIIVFRYEDKKPYYIYTSKQTFEKHSYLLLITNGNNLNYVLIKDFNRFITNKTNHHRKTYFCQYCLQCLSSEKMQEKHVKICTTINDGNMGRKLIQETCELQKTVKSVIHNQR